jgi:hypothetical protein
MNVELGGKYETVAYSQAENYPQSLLNGISATN